LFSIGFSFFAGTAWREFGWGALASGFGETLLHPVDTLKTRIQSGGQTGLSLQVGNLIPPPPPVFTFLHLFFISCRNCIFCNSFACQVHSNIPAFQHAWSGVFIKQKSKPSSFWLYPALAQGYTLHISETQDAGFV
jgi:hypothetical protein